MIFPLNRFGKRRVVPQWREGIELRVPEQMFSAVLDHTTDRRLGEEAGFLLCATATTAKGAILLAERWLPVPEEEIIARDIDYVVQWSSRFNSDAIVQADALGCGLVLLHYHGGLKPRLSDPDRLSAEALFPSMSRLLSQRLSGSIVLGNSGASGLLWRGSGPPQPLARLRVIGNHLEDWLPEPLEKDVQPRHRLTRQNQAIGERADVILRSSTVAVVGVSGGGSHVFQQLLHQGIGTLLPIDPQLVEESNLGRMVGAELRDVNRTPKIDVARRLATRLDPNVAVRGVRSTFPAPELLSALKEADVVVGCVDSWRTRECLNEFCRRYHIPYVDIGLNIQTKEGWLVRADGQLVVVTPDSACMRCLPILSDAVLEKERKEHPPGYDLGSLAGDPQVVSMNGTLASEASNAVLDLLTGYSNGKRGPGWWQYDGRGGTIERVQMRMPRPGCPACAQMGHGDPNF